MTDQNLDEKNNSQGDGGETPSTPIEPAGMEESAKDLPNEMSAAQSSQDSGNTLTTAETASPSNDESAQKEATPSADHSAEKKLDTNGHGSGHGNAQGSGHGNGHGSAKKESVDFKLKLKAVLFLAKNYLTRPGSLWATVHDVFSSVMSYDSATRKMSILFVLSLMGSLVVLGVGFERYMLARKIARKLEAQRIARLQKELELKNAEESKRKVSIVSLGSFTLELKPNENHRPGVGVGILNTAEVEIMFLCDSDETQEYISDHIVQVRNQMTQVFLPIDREEILSREGKKRIKNTVIRKVNGWLPNGRVLDMYYSKLIVH